MSGEIERKKGFWKRVFGEGEDGPSAEQIIEALGQELEATKQVAERLAQDRDAAHRAGLARAEELAHALARATGDADQTRKEAQREIALLRRSLEEAQKETAKARAEATAARTKLDERTRDHAAQLKAQEVRIASLQRDVTTLSNELTSVRHALVAEQTKSARALEDVAATRSALARESRQSQDLERELADASTETMGLRSTLAERERALATECEAHARTRRVAHLLHDVVASALDDALGDGASVALSIAWRDRREALLRETEMHDAASALSVPLQLLTGAADLLPVEAGDAVLLRAANGTSPFTSARRRSTAALVAALGGDATFDDEASSREWRIRVRSRPPESP